MANSPNLMPAPHFLHVTPSFVAAGAQQRTVALMRAFGTDYSHSVLALDGNTSALELVPDDLDVSAIAAPEPSLMGAAGALRRLLRKLRPDLLLTYNWGSFDAVLAARSLGLGRHVHHEDGFNADEAGGQKQRRVTMRRFGLRGSHGVVVPSTVLESIALDVWRLPARLVNLIPNGIEVERFAPPAPHDTELSRAASALRQSLAIPHEAFVIGAVGHLRPVKRFDRLIDAFQRASTQSERKLHLLLIGAGPEDEALRTQATKTGAPITFAGHQSELAPYYRALDALCITSESEQHPVCLLEALAAGVPVVATDVGDIRAMLPSATHAGIVSQDGPELIERLASALGELAAAPERCAEWARLGSERVASAYSFAAMVARYRELYEAARQR